MQRFRSRLRPLILSITLLGSLSLAIQPTLAVTSWPPQETDPNCSPNVVPTGQADPSAQIEPMGPIWCFDLDQMPTTRSTGANDWVDDFNTNAQMGRLNDGDMDYRIFDSMHNDPGQRAQHFINNHHWMTDTADEAGRTNSGDTLRPNRSFTFENGKLVVEGDVAAGIADYGADVWPEITLSMAPAPSHDIVDSLYAHGAFGGFWTVGCRLHSGGLIVCAVESDQHNIPDNKASCNEAAPSRVMEISDFQVCGTTHSGGNHAGDNSAFWRLCDHNVMDMFCRDRFRLELTKDSLSVFVNGHLYFQDAGWDADHQLPASAVSGDWYAYFSDWRSRPTGLAYRFHWGRLAVNPHDADGNNAAPSVSPFFCLGMLQNSCMTVSNGQIQMPRVPAPAVAPTPEDGSIGMAMPDGQDASPSDNEQQP